MTDAQIQSAWVTKLCTVVPNIWSTLIAVCYVHTKMCIGSHAPSRKYWITLRFASLSQRCESSAWNLLHVSLLAPRIWWWLLHFWKIYEPLRK
jgi:hypothetical protein